jgi:formylglycine-generating enzyme required for sulfatase activity
MHGNVEEWCQDRFGNYPQNDVVDSQGADTGQYRVLRGGYFGSHPLTCRSAFRSSSYSGSCFDHYGFRLCFCPAEDKSERHQAVSLERADHPQPQPKAGEIITNSLGMKLAWIPPGSFVMGSPPDEQHRRDDETQHKVMLTKGFYLGVYQVTQEQWQALMGHNPSEFKGDKNLPVEQVSWERCQGFLKRLSKKEDEEYRLPTEAEWEYACRAGTTTPFYFGETISTEQANYDGNCVYGKGKKGVYRKKTTPVGSFPPNAWGLYDMHGNVLEWCLDWYGKYPTGEVVDPQGPPSGENHVLRGGSFLIGPYRCAERRSNESFNWDVGFRVARTFTA